ncbi:MAG: hypothetical protein H7175_12110 [Burkholderiales bacterium]|nr:hypothetical protein [Anaerolineae bacterium]
MLPDEKPSFLLDTGPLSVLCSFPIKQSPFINVVSQYAKILLPNAVMDEIGEAGKMSRIVPSLLKRDIVFSIEAPPTPAILDTAYGKILGPGERSVIKCGLNTALPIVLDDQDAFIIACRFGLHPMGFQDFIVQLVTEYTLPKAVAVEIIRLSARQFPAVYLVHTLDMLS